MELNDFAKDAVRQYMRSLGKKGGKALVEKRGREHMSAIGKNRWKAKYPNGKANGTSSK